MVHVSISPLIMICPRAVFGAPGVSTDTEDTDEYAVGDCRGVGGAFEPPSGAGPGWPVSEWRHH